MLAFATHRVYLATSARVTNVAPGAQRPQLLWSADTLSVSGPRSR